MIDLKAINKVYPKTQTLALRNINLTINAHELIAIMGPSGSGKSSLLNIIGLLDRASTGSYYLNHRPIETLSDEEIAHVRNTEIGFVFQSFFLLPYINVERNIALPLLYRGFSFRKSKAYVLRILHQLNLQHLKDRKPNQLSGGEQQRIAIARALVGEPSIIIADEPTGALDSRTGQQIMNVFLELHQKKNKTIIIATHNQEIAQQCQRWIAMKDGEIIKDYTG